MSLPSSSRKSYEKVLDREVTALMHKTLLGQELDLPQPWAQQGFTFRSTGLLCGLTQHEGGACGVLAAVQAFVVRELLLAEGRERLGGRGVADRALRRARVLVGVRGEERQRGRHVLFAVLLAAGLDDGGQRLEAEGEARRVVAEDPILDVRQQLRLDGLRGGGAVLLRVHVRQVHARRGLPLQTRLHLSLRGVLGRGEAVGARARDAEVPARSRGAGEPARIDPGEHEALEVPRQSQEARLPPRGRR